MRKLYLAASFIVFAMLIDAGAVKAETYPSRPIQMLVPFSPGTGPDILARTIGDKISESLKTPVVVINRPGAGGILGAAEIARSNPDGYDILVAANGLLMAVHLNKVSYQPIDSFAPISLASTGKLILVANPKTKINSVAALIERAKSEPGKLNYGSAGIGTPHHLAMELFKLVTGTDLTHVPYKGVAGAVSDTIGGHIDVMFVPIHVALPQIAAGKLTALAVGSKSRSDALANVPTLVELGYEINVDVWSAFLAPAGTPTDIVQTLNREIHRALADNEVRSVLERQGLQAAPSSPEELRALMQKDYRIWGEVINKNKVVAQ